jgi:dTDP-4-dehydrorhamnose 3,5-epimerase
LELIKTPIQDLVILKPVVFADDRGYFFESFNQKKFEQLTGFKVNFVQDNQSLSQQNVLRGLHFQAPPFAQDKLVRVISGAVLDVAVDIRAESPTYGQSFQCELSASNQLQMFIPAGFAHGFLTLEPDTIFTYKCSNYYHQPSEGCLLWNDTDLNIAWPCSNPVVSPKDALGQSFKNFKSPFTSN